MIITRGWRLGSVKTYFGVTGGKEKVLEQLQAYKEKLTTQPKA